MPESKKVVLKLNIPDNECKRKALKAVSGLSGIESLAIEMKDNKLTIIGKVDPVKVTGKLKKWHAVILTLGPAKEPEKKEPEKKEPEKKGGEDDEAKKKKKEQQEREEAINRMIEEACRCRGYNPYPPQGLCIYHVEEAPTGCVIF